MNAENDVVDHVIDHLDPQACYQALKSHDARFDGRFFVAVSSTRIYCRPVCRVRTPKFENCRFFDRAAQAESQGYRPCMRCRPELAPRQLPWTTHDASKILAMQAAHWLDEPTMWHGDKPTMSQLSAHLGVSERHVRRIFEVQFGISPLQYLQTRRLLTAKQLLTDTQLPIANIAFTSGYCSVRRFSDAFLTHYRFNPSQLRKTARNNLTNVVSSQEASHCTVKLSYRPPYYSQWILQFLHKRLLNTTEFIAKNSLNTPAIFTLCLNKDDKFYTGWLSFEFLVDQPNVLLKVSTSLLDVLPEVIRRVRELLDLDADPMTINAVLKNSLNHHDYATPDKFAGIRVPGCLNGFELAIRAILGQQVTVAAGRTLTQRLVDAYGSTIETPFPTLTKLFPSPEALAATSGDALGQLGIVKQRQAAIVSLAKAVAAGQLRLDSGVNIEATMSKLRELPGVGDWTAQYIAMRALRWPDAFVAGDVALHKAMGLLNLEPKLSPAKTAAAALEASQTWRPWRSYAVMRAWTTLT